MPNLFGELKRRNVFRVGVAYLIAAWLVLQVLDLVLENIDAPAWIMRLAMILIALGFPLVLGFAWAFELTPEGVKREKHVDRSKSITAHTGRRLDRLITVILIIAVGVLLTDRFLHRSSSEGEPARPVASAEPRSDGSRRSIAVLPFANRSNAADDVFFVDGIHDDILTHLAKISSLKVISRTSVMRYRDTQKPIREIGDELDVATIMEGSVQRAGDRVRINVQLIDAETDEHLWAEIYDRALTASNIFDIQTEMSKAIAGELRANLTSDEEQRLAQKPTENLEAYEAYLLGRQLLATRSVQSIADAKAWFLKAINLDPDFALAYVGVSDSIQLQVDYGGWSPRVAAREAKPYVDRALELEPDLGEAHVSFASMLEYAGDFDAAEAAYLHGLDLAPNYAQGHMWYGLFQQLIRGQPYKALARFQRAAVHDPLYVINLGNVSTGLRAVGRFDESRAVLEKMRDIDPRHPRAYSFTAYDKWMVQGQLDLAHDALSRAMAVDPDDPGIRVEMAQLYMDLNDDETASCWLDMATVLNPDASYIIDERAILSAIQNDRDAAADLVQRGLQEIHIPYWRSLSLAILKGYFLNEGRPNDALELYRAVFPELFGEASINIHRMNAAAAVDVADILLAMNQPDRAYQLLSEVDALLKDVPRLGEFGHMITDVRIATLRGDTNLALEMLQQAVEEGWRFRWRYFMEVNNVLEPLRSSRKFESIYQQISADMAAQLERVRARETLETTCSPESI